MKAAEVVIVLMVLAVIVGIMAAIVSVPQGGL
jgi:hypothetical protein